MYINWSEKTITNFTEKNINELYNIGFLFTRAGKGKLYETRSVRIDLNKFELSSENRRVLRKTEEVKMETIQIPYSDYSWEVGKFGKDYYETKFGKGIFSANKIKELLTDKDKSNFNLLLKFTSQDKTLGYVVCYENQEIVHYCYPFYDLNSNISNLGIGMMTKAIVWAKENKKRYVYLGSVKDRAGLYKFQFEGMEWWDKKTWQNNLNILKQQIL